MVPVPLVARGGRTVADRTYRLVTLLHTAHCDSTRPGCIRWKTANSCGTRLPTVTALPAYTPHAPHRTTTPHHTPPRHYTYTTALHTPQLHCPHPAPYPTYHTTTTPPHLHHPTARPAAWRWDACYAVDTKFATSTTHCMTLHGCMRIQNRCWHRPVVRASSSTTARYHAPPSRLERRPSPAFAFSDVHAPGDAIITPPPLSCSLRIKACVRPLPRTFFWRFVTRYNTFPDTLRSNLSY